MSIRRDGSRIGLQGDWDGVLWGRGCLPPKAIMPPRPITLRFPAEEVRARLRRIENESVPQIRSEGRLDREAVGESDE